MHILIAVVLLLLGARLAVAAPITFYFAGVWQSRRPR